MISSYLQPGARKLEGCVRSNAIENDNRSWWLPWQHLSIIFITVLTTAHVPSTLNGYSWFYAVQVSLTAVELVWVWVQTAA